MASELHLRPDRLRAHAATAATLADELRAAGARPSVAEPEAQRLRTAVLRAVDDLAELGAVLTAAATSAERGDDAAARALGCLPQIS